ncbi:MAG: GspE/PulE family protein [Candidatus Omnitrophica bacterium]|nr:GspE/PulE family protein [Candidatus Omnitrophota bacterium]
MATKKLGEILIKGGWITKEQLDKALFEQKTTGELLGVILVKNNYLSEEQLLDILSQKLKILRIKKEDIEVDPEAVKKVPAKFVFHYKIMPINFEKETNTLTVASPYFLSSLEDVKVFLGCKVNPVLATQKEITDLIDKYYAVGSETVEDIIAAGPKDSGQKDRASEEVEDIERLAEDASIVRLVNQIILDANSKRATDIHIEPFRGKTSIRYRIDGMLYDANIPQNIGNFFQAIISRIKIMANLNIVERRLPQDGRAVIRIGSEEFDLRISILPTLETESIVIRILPTKMLFSLEKLGLAPEELKILEGLFKKPHGIIFVSGPTGSGKTTTLYASLKKVKNTTNKIITLEDPIEYELSGITQVQMFPEIGLTFAKGLRSVLRHDPDIIMVGEVRDFETAELAIRAALTGHLIFSTIHTNSAAGGVSRLLDIGVEPFLLASSAEAFIAQRLIRLICPNCKEEDQSVTDEIKKEIKKETGASKLRFYKGKGCQKCNFTGFMGRSAIYEILLIDKEMRKLILNQASAEEIKSKAINSGMRSLRLGGWEKVVEGVTSVDEVMRVTQKTEY